MPRHEFIEFLRITVAGNLLPLLAALASYRCRIRFTQPGGGFDKRIEDGVQIKRRSADDFEHIGGRGLLLKRLAQLAEQSRVFDCNYGLIGERGHKLNLAISKRANGSSQERNHADRCPLSQKRDAQ